MTQGLLRIYVEDKDGNVVSFPPNEEQAVVKDWTRTAERMAGAPSVTGTVMHKLCLDNFWTKKEFVIIGGERYYVKQVPTSSKDTEDVRYKHDVTLVSERDILENVYFFDVVTKREDAQASDKPRSNTTDFSFYGDLKELVERLNDSLSYSKIYDAKGVNGFCIVIDDDDLIGEAQEVSITDAYFATAMQEIYNVFGVPYYWVGKICHVGYTQNEISTPFEYGKDNGLLSVSKNNSEYRLINRITGMGSADNIPYYYPNTDPNGEPILTIKNMDRVNIKSIQLTTINSKFGGSVGKTFCLGNIKEGNATTELFNDDKTLNGIAKYAAPYLDDDSGTEGYVDEDPVDSQEEQLPMILEFEFYAYVNDEIDASNLSINTTYKISGATTTIDFSKSSQPHWGQTCSPPIEGWDAEAKIIMPDGYEEIITANDTTYRCKKQGVHKLIINCTPSYRVSMHPASKPEQLEWATIDWYCHINGSIKFKTFYGDVIYESGKLFKIDESGISIIGDNLPKLDLVLQPSQDYGSFDAHIIGGSIATCAQFTITGIDFINPISKLMPYVYREQKGAERFYNAVNEKYLKENGEYYSFNNPYLSNEPLEGKQDFEDIKPTINGITNAQGQLFGEVADIAFDETDSDDLAIENGESNSAKLVHSYFYIKLHKFDGDYGFNLFKQGLSKGAMTLNFISGSCAGCAFEVGVSKPSQVDNHYEFVNPIQVDELGNIVAGDYDDKVKEGNPIKSQQDTTTNEVWIALKKDQSTFGVVMPNATNDYKPKAGDKFVITNILLPQVYITAAEKRLEAALIKYMSENNDEKFTFSIKFSRIYLQKHIEDIVPYLNENARINVKYNNTTYPLYVSSYTQKYDGNILDEISVELSEELTITQNKSKQQMDSILGNVNEQINSALKDNSNNSQQEVTDSDLMAIKNLLNNKLSKVTSDTAAGIITFLQGIISQGKVRAEEGVVIGQFVQGFLGTGGNVDAKGNAEFESIFARSFISTPELRYNRITVTDGELWITNGNGIIESIDTENMIITLHLEENDFASVAEGDLCRGIYNNFGTTGEYQNFITLDADDCGFPVKAGFFTSYFRVAEILEQSKGKCSFRYELRNSSTPHPCAQMKFAQYGNDIDETRQASAFISSIGHFYFESMEHVDTWDIQQENITIRWGWVDGFVVKNNDGTTSLLRNYGLYVPDNIYFGNAVVQLDPKTIDSLRKEMEQYSIELSNYTDVITVDDAGNVIDGLYKLAVEGDLTTKYDYRIAPAVFVKKGNEYLIEADSGDDAAEGTYKMYITPKNCTAEIINGTVCVTAIDNIKDGVSGTDDDVDFDYDAMRKMESISVVISVMCEGKGSITKEFKVAIKHDSKPYVSMTMDNQNASVSWNTKAQKYIGLPYSFNITAARANDLTPISEVSVVAPEGVTVTSEIKKGVAVLSVTSLPQTLGNVTDIKVTATTTYAGISYEQTLVHTLNRYEDVNVYELKPSVTQVVASVNTSGEKVADVEKVTCSVICSSSDDKQYILTAEQMTTVKAVVKYSIDDSSTLSELPADGISVSPEWSKIVFHLLIDGSEIDSQDVPVMLNGVDGEGIEYVFILTKQEVVPNITFDANSDEYQQPDYLPTSTSKDTEPLGQWTDNSNGVGANYPYEWCSIRRKQYGKWLSFETPKLWGRYAKDGENPYVIDLTNENSSVLVSDTGAAISAYEQTSLVIYEGTKDVTSTFTVTFSADGITCTETSKKYTYSFSAITKDLANVTFTATNGSVTLKAIYTVACIKNGAIYSLICSHDTIHLDNTGSPVSTDKTMYLSIRKTTPEGDTISTSVTEWKKWGVNVYYLNSGGTYTAFATSNDISYSTAFASRTYASFQIRKTSDGTTILDSERVNAVSDGVSITGITVKYQISSNPAIAPSSWEDSSPSVTFENPYLWSQTTITYSKGSPTVKVACIGKMGDKGIDGNGEEWIYYLSNSSSFTATDNTNPAKWEANQTDDYVMAGTGWTDDPSGVTESNQYEWVSHRSKVNGTWGEFSQPSIWAKWGEKGDDAVNYSLVPNMTTISVDGEGKVLSTGSIVITLKKSAGASVSDSSDYNIFTYYVYNDGNKSIFGSLNGFSSPASITLNGSVAENLVGYYFEVRNSLGILAALSIPLVRQGKPSFSLVDRGIWSADGGYSYKYDNEILVRDMVKYPIGGIYYYYMVAKRTDLTGTNVPVTGSAQSPSNTDYWEQGSKYNLLVADVVYADNATLGGFHINQDSLWAGGDTPEDAKVLLDGKNGTAKVTGEVNATSGSFEYCNIGKGCTIKNDNGWNLNSDNTGNGWQLDGVGNMTIEFYLRYRTSGSDINKLYMCNGAEGQYMFQLNGSHGVFINASDAMNVTGTSTFNGNTYLSGNITSVKGVRISTYTMSSNGTIPSSADLVTFTNSSPITVGLPSASGCKGKVLYLKKLGSGSVTLSGSSSNLIVGAGGTGTSTTTEHVGSSKSMMYISDGTYWIEFYCG